MAEDYPGQDNERRRWDLIQSAVAAGNMVLMKGCDGSEELDALQAEVASKWADKVRMAAQARLRAKDMQEIQSFKDHGQSSGQR